MRTLLKDAAVRETISNDYSKKVLILSLGILSTLLVLAAGVIVFPSLVFGIVKEFPETRGLITVALFWDWITVTLMLTVVSSYSLIKFQCTRSTASLIVIRNAWKVITLAASFQVLSNISAFVVIKSYASLTPAALLGLGGLSLCSIVVALVAFYRMSITPKI